jgi:hypothetical protein
MFSAASKTGSQPSAAANYIEDVFSTYLYTGTGANQTITNGIDLSTKGGMVWIKSRTSIPSSPAHMIADTVRGPTVTLSSDTTSANEADTDRYQSFNSNGFSIKTSARLNYSANPYVSWTFAEQAKFFDIVTYTGNGINRSIAHNLGSVPGMMIVKSTSDPKLWAVYHRSIGNTNLLVLNSTTDAITNAEMWNNTTPTSTVFTVGTNTNTNASGNTYVAYLFAHNAGGFGTSGTDNVISCGSYTGNGSSTGTSINLGYEPQYVLIKGSSLSQDWFLTDVMRGMPVGGGDNALQPNLADAEFTGLNYINPTATGFDITSAGSSFNGSGETYIYMAIRRPMKVPTDATTVFSTNIETTTTNPQTLTTGFPVDLSINTRRNSTTSKFFVDRLRGSSTTSINYLTSNNTNQETNLTSLGIGFANNTGIVDSGWFNESGAIFWNLRRASGFFDEVCYTGDGASTRQVTHNLTVTPQLIIIKNRGAVDSWEVRYPSVANRKDLLLNLNIAESSLAFTPADTSTTFTVSVSGNAATNDNANTYVAYLFATCPGVSKVGSYTGNGTTQAISCGFTGGARFVLIKRTDSTGDWYVYDTARGMTTLTDPYLLLNDTAAETATLGSVTTTAGGFTVNSTILAAINVSGGTYIFLAIA